MTGNTLNTNPSLTNDKSPSIDNDLKNSIKLIPFNSSSNSNLNSSNSSNEMKQQKYKEFVKILLKVKFEKLHSTHHGQQIPERVLFMKCIYENVPQEEWADFILKEMKQPNKYSKYFKINNNKKYNRSLTNK